MRKIIIRGSIWLFFMLFSAYFHSNAMEKKRLKESNKSIPIDIPHKKDKNNGYVIISLPECIALTRLSSTSLEDRRDSRR